MTAHNWNRKREIPSPSTHIRQKEQTTVGWGCKLWEHTSSDILPPSKALPAKGSAASPNNSATGNQMFSMHTYGECFSFKYHSGKSPCYTSMRTQMCFTSTYIKPGVGRMHLEAQGLGFLVSLSNWNSVVQVHGQTWSQKLQFYLSFLWWRQIPNVGFQPLHAHVHAGVPGHGHACYTSQSQRMGENSRYKAANRVTLKWEE